MSDEWLITTLGKVAVLTIGRTPERGNSNYWTEDVTYPFCTISDIPKYSWSINPTNEGVTQAAIRDGKARMAAAGSLLMSFKLSIGRVGFAHRDVYPNEAIVRIDTSKNPEIEPEYLALWLESLNLSDTGDTQHAVRGKTLNKTSLAAIPVAVPPRTTQQRIVRLIRSVDETITALDDEAHAALRTRAPLIDRMLDGDWPTKALGEIGAFTRGKRFTKSDYVPSGIGCIHYGQIYTEYGATASATITFIPETLRPKMRFAGHGDLVVAGTSENVEDVGKAVAWLGHDEVAVHDDAYIYRHDLEPAFAPYLFASSVFQGQKVTTESKVVRISAANLAKIQVPFPPKDIQEQVSAAVGALDETVAVSQAESLRLKGVRAALLDDLLSERGVSPQTDTDLS